MKYLRMLGMGLIAAVLFLSLLTLKGVGQEIVDGQEGRVAGKARPELPPGLDLDAVRAELDVQVGIGGQELRLHLDEGGLWDGDLQVLENSRGERFVDQDAAVLGVVAELDDVPMAVVGLEELGLSASSHFSDVPDRGERHSKENAVP